MSTGTQVVRNALDDAIDAFVAGRMDEFRAGMALGAISIATTYLDADRIEAQKARDRVHELMQRARRLEREQQAKERR